MSWIDPRVVFLNLKHETYHNILPETEKRLLWYPSVTFSNTPGQDWSVTDNETLVTVRREGLPVVSMDTDTRTVNKFSGRENHLWSPWGRSRSYRSGQTPREKISSLKILQQMLRRFLMMTRSWDWMSSPCQSLLTPSQHPPHDT